MPINNTMQAVWISTFGGPEVLEIRTVGKPLINDEQVLVRVRASSLNRADLLQRMQIWVSASCESPARTKQV